MPADTLQLHLFEQVADGLHSLVPPELGPWHQRNHRYGIKVWFGDAAKPSREHFEAQVVGAEARTARRRSSPSRSASTPSTPIRRRNAAALARLAEVEKRWRRTLGDEAVAGPFLGREGSWTRAVGDLARP